MSVINTRIKPFTANAFHAGKFVTVSDADLRGRWSVLIFMPPRSRSTARPKSRTPPTTTRSSAASAPRST